MAKVPLDGLRIEVPHAASSAEVAGRLEAFAQDMAQNKFREWGVSIVRHGETHLQLAGRRDGTHFDAEVRAEDRRAVVSLTGSIELSRLKLTLAGGVQGVRRRVEDELAATLREHLA
ncbi:MAG: hypothetical protein D6731_25285 [Planctomycetota bacterium]|nr:MAG: hypothetical protein D6731_25285 [Planctomycetota bacterium]